LAAILFVHFSWIGVIYRYAAGLPGAQRTQVHPKAVEVTAISNWLSARGCFCSGARRPCGLSWAIRSISLRVLSDGTSKAIATRFILMIGQLYGGLWTDSS